MSHTPGPWVFREFMQTDETIAEMRSLGMKTPPTQCLTNDGGRPIMGPNGRLAVVDCLTEYKRGKGSETVCAERDANARLIVSAPELLAALAALIHEDGGSVAHSAEHPKCVSARAAIAKATGAA